MRAQREYLDGLARLHLIADSGEQRGVWRQSMATLASEASELTPVPLEGLDPDAVLESTRCAIDTGLIDDLDFLSPAASAAALYELAAVLPMGDERRELGRRVARRLHDGDAATFVTLATQLALGSKRALSGAAIRARVALALDLPIGSGTRADALALALISRRELAEEWLVAPASGALPSRRLAARLLERAAREAARRCDHGNDSVLQVFERGPVLKAWSRLLLDREPLVWRHVASARGLLTEHAPHLADEIRTQLDPALSPTEWRRAAASLAASIAVRPTEALAQANELLASRLFVRDPGLAGAMLLGVPRAAEVEPEAAEELCTALVRAGGIDAAEAMLSLRHERVGGEFGAWACQMARAKLREDGLLDSNDDGTAALALALDQDLRHADERDAPPSLRMYLEGALAAFAEDGAKAAYSRAHAVLHEVEATLRRLESSNLSVSEGRREAFLALRELDGALMETSTLSDLLTLGARTEDDTTIKPLEVMFARLSQWLLHVEREPIRAHETIEHPTWRIHRIRSLLHLVDADGSWSEKKSPALRDRRIQTARALLARVRDDAPSILTRVVTAAAARACDALLREEVGELSDVFLLAISHVETLKGLTTMAEASMVPDMEGVFHAYAGLVSRTQRDVRTTITRSRAGLDALQALIRSFPAAIGPRVDALHRALLAFSRAIEGVLAARSLGQLAEHAEGVGSPIQALEEATRLLCRLVVGAQRRLGSLPQDTTGVAASSLRLVDIAVERAYRGDPNPLGEAVAACISALHEDLPTHFAEVAANTVVRAVQLPRDASTSAARHDSFHPAPRKEAPLPAWLPPSRTLGGFYVLRALGSGAGGSVFIARRSEEKKNEGAPRFALKVPEYTGAAARTLSEEEFLRLFREEAGALLAIPQHENLAQLVTFDSGARPKPILVMELVEGPTLERMIETGALDVRLSFSLLDGIAAGLDAMHQIGVGHLDLKPSNVILRDIDLVLGMSGTPVLVDFGLAGRHVRPGCATASYGAPEVWGLMPKGHDPNPTAADVYAFGALVFEVLTGRELVHGSSEIAIITAHLAHDGDFDGLRWLAQDRSLSDIAKVISGAMRQDPRSRTLMSDLRAQLAEIAPTLEKHRWPLGIDAAAE